MATPTATMDRTVASRLAGALAGIDGVRSALVCDLDGTALGAAGCAEPARDAALASVVALRAEALPVDGDLRGMGRQLAGSRFGHVSVSGSGSEGLVYRLEHACLYLALATGRTTTVLAALAPILRRFALTTHPATRSR